MDDAQLLSQYAESGSDAAFAELVGRHFNLVHSIAARRLGGDLHRAKDVAQIVFIDMARKAASLSRHPALIGWLYRSTYFAAKQVIRGEERRQNRENKAEKMNKILFSPAREVDWSQLQFVLEGAMDELSERDRTAVLWRFFEAQPLAALGEKLGVSETAARKRVDRALEKMRRSFTRRGIESTTAALATMLTSHAVVAAPTGVAESVTRAALASIAGAGWQGTGLWRLLAKARAAIGVPGALWIGSILGVLGIGTVVHEHAAARQAQAALAGENHGYAVQEEHLRDLEKASDTSAPAARTAAASRAAAWDSEGEFRKFTAAYPRARVDLAEQTTSLVVRAYGSFLKSAGLTPAQIGQFKGLMVESWMGTMAIKPNDFALQMEGLPNPPEEQMRAILGDEGYREFQEYGQSVYAHYWAYALAGNPAAVSISSDQMDQLAQVLINNNSIPGRPYSIATAELASIDWDAALDQAKPLFSAAQWKAAEPVLLQMQAVALSKSLQAQASRETP